MPIKRLREVSMPENAREHRAVRRDAMVVTAVEGTGRVVTAMNAGRR